MLLILVEELLTNSFFVLQAALFPPQLSDLVLNFCSATSFWLNQMVMAGPDYLDMVKPIELKAKNLPTDVCDLM